MTSWAPHGQIKNRDLEEAYQNALNAQGKEFYAVILIEDLSNSEWFPRPEYKTNSQVPPSDTGGYNKACDLATSFIDSGYKWHLFFFQEGKRAKRTSQSNIKALEIQAQGYCKDFLNSHQDVDMVYANTFVGVHVRFWSFTRGDDILRGFWRGDEKDHFEHYRDVGRESHSGDIEGAIRHMKTVPIGGALPRGLDHDRIGSSHFPTTQPLSMGSLSTALPTYQPAAYYGQPATAGPSSGYDYTYPIAQAPTSSTFSSQASDTEVGDDVEEHHALVPAGAIYVEVSSQLKDGKELYHFNSGDQHYAKEGHEWEERTVTAKDGKTYDCFLYTGRKTGTHFYTYSLRDVPVYTPVRESGKKGKGRR
jgi:hypothetical protein